MNIHGLHRGMVLPVALLALLVPATVSHGQALLVVVEETLNGATLQPPLSAREGLAATLFDDGLVVLDLPGGSTADMDQLSRTAASAGADYVLAVSVTYTATGGDLPVIRGHASYRLAGVPGGALLLQSSTDVSNQGREKSVDRNGVGEEIGQAIAGKAWDTLRTMAR